MNPRTWYRLRTSLFLCTALLCLLHVAAPMVLRLASGTPCYAVGIGLEVLWRTIGLCVLVFVFYVDFCKMEIRLTLGRKNLLVDFSSRERKCFPYGHISPSSRKSLV